MPFYNVQNFFKKVGGLLRELGCEFDICRNHLNYITGSETRFTVKNLHTGCDMTISIKEYIMGYNSSSSVYLHFDNYRYHFLFGKDSNTLDTIRDIIKNNIGLCKIYFGEKQNPPELGCVYRADVECKPPLECFDKCPRLGCGYSMSEQIKGQCLRYGAEIRFIFWDPQYDRSVIIEKESKT